MPRKGWVNKSTATTYQLLHRPQNDPKIYDDSSSSMVFQELAPTQARKTRNRIDLERELFGGSNEGSKSVFVRDNEGEAAEYGVFYDDTEYDYMQHMRNLGGINKSESIWVDAHNNDSSKRKGKDKVSLDHVLKHFDASQKTNWMLKSEFPAKLTDESILPSTVLRETTYQDQQDLPDSLTGLQPSMNPDLREALEALEDENFVDDDAEDDSFFNSIAQSGEELTQDEFEELDSLDVGENEDWETDDTEKPADGYKQSLTATINELIEGTSQIVPNADIANTTTQYELPDHGDGAFMAAFRDLPKSSRIAKTPLQPSFGRGASSIQTGATAFSTIEGRRKRRKGALTNSEAFSMTSSSLFRTEGLTLLDARFDKTMEAYKEVGEDDGHDHFADHETSSVTTDCVSDVSNNSIVSAASGISRISGISGLSHRSSQPPDLVVRKDFDNIMDEFLGSHSMKGKRRLKKGGLQSGMAQLDEIREGLGKPVHKAVAAACGP